MQEISIKPKLQQLLPLLAVAVEIKAEQVSHSQWVVEEDQLLDHKEEETDHEVVEDLEVVEDQEVDLEADQEVDLEADLEADLEVEVDPEADLEADLEAEEEAQEEAHQLELKTQAGLQPVQTRSDLEELHQIQLKLLVVRTIPTTEESKINQEQERIVLAGLKAPPILQSSIQQRVLTRTFVEIQLQMRMPRQFGASSKMELLFTIGNTVILLVEELRHHHQAQPHPQVVEVEEEVVEEVAEEVVEEVEEEVELMNQEEI